MRMIVIMRIFIIVITDLRTDTTKNLVINDQIFESSMIIKHLPTMTFSGRH
jgi:hypothetical protein